MEIVIEEIEIGKINEKREIELKEREERKK